MATLLPKLPDGKFMECRLNDEQNKCELKDLVENKPFLFYDAINGNSISHHI